MTARQLPALLAATPPARAERGGPVGLYRNASMAAEVMIGAMTSLADADSVLQRAGISRWQLRELEFDDEIAGALDTRRDAVLSTPWRLDGENADGDRADFLTAQLTACYDSIVRGAWNAVPYGYSVMEAVYAEEGGRVVLSSCSERPMEWFRLQRDGRIWVTVGGLPETECDQVFKWFATRRNPTWRNPMGDALLSRLYWPWHFRTNAWRFWLEFLERFGAPMVMGKSAKPKELAEALVQMGASSAIAVGLTDDVEAVTSGAAAGEFERAENALSRRIQKLVLGQTGTTDSTGKGSYAATKIQNEVRDDRRKADLRLITPAVQRIVDALWALNRFPGKAPTFLLDDGVGLQTERAERDAKLVQAGVLRLTDSYLARAYDYEPGDFEVADAAPPAPAQRDPIQQRGRAPLGLANALRFTRRQMEVEGIGDALLASGGAVTQDAVRAAVRAAQSPEDLAERLAMLLPESPEHEFADALSRALFAADVLGYAQEQEGGPLFGERMALAASRQQAAQPAASAQLSEMAAALLALASRPQAAPNFSVVLPQGLELSIPTPVINVAAPIVNVAAPNVNVEPPAVIVSPPAVTVQVEAPAVTVDMPAPGPTETRIQERDAQGRASRFVTRPID